MKNKTKTYEPATELLPLILQCDGDYMYADGYDANNIQDFNELRADTNWELARLFINNILKIDDNSNGVLNAVVGLMYSDKTFQQIEKIIRKQFNIKK